jgi:hypothetical protein
VIKVANDQYGKAVARVTRCLFEKSHPKCSPTRILSKLLGLQPFFVEKLAKNVKQIIILINAKVNNRPMGEISPNLVTLAVCSQNKRNKCL